MMSYSQQPLQPLFGQHALCAIQAFDQSLSRLEYLVEASRGTGASTHRLEIDLETKRCRSLWEQIADYLQTKEYGLGIDYTDELRGDFVSKAAITKGLFDILRNIGYVELHDEKGEVLMAQNPLGDFNAQKKRFMQLIAYVAQTDALSESMHQRCLNQVDNWACKEDIVQFFESESNLHNACLGKMIASLSQAVCAPMHVMTQHALYARTTDIQCLAPNDHKPSYVVEKCKTLHGSIVFRAHQLIPMCVINAAHPKQLALNYKECITALIDPKVTHNIKVEGKLTQFDPHQANMQRIAMSLCDAFYCLGYEISRCLRAIEKQNRLRWRNESPSSCIRYWIEALLDLLRTLLSRCTKYDMRKVKTVDARDAVLEKNGLFASKVRFAFSALKTPISHR